jgi:PAS domain S-box-containing protein
MFKQKLDYRVLLDSVEAPVLLLKKDLKILLCNEAYASLFNCSASSLEGQNLLARFPETAGTLSHRVYLKVLETGKPKITEGRIANKFFRQRIYPVAEGILILAENIDKQKRLEKILQAFEVGHRAIFDECTDAVLIFDAHTQDIVDVNKTTCQLFARSFEEMLELNAGDLSAEDPPYTRNNFVRWLKNTSDTEIQVMEWMARDKSGRQFWIEAKSKHLLIDDQMRIVTIIKDKNEYKLLKKEIRDIEEHYRDFFDKTDYFVFQLDLEGNFISVNPASERITGFWREEMLKMNIQELASEAYLHSLQSLVYRRLSRNKNTNFELGIINKFGNELILDVDIWPLYRAGDVEPIAVQGIARDITERCVQEAKLRASKKDLESFIDFLPDATMAIDLEGKVIAWNKAMEALTGIPARDMLGKGDYEYGLAFYNTRRPIMVDLVLRPEEVKKFYSVMEVDQYMVISEFDTPNLRGEGHYLWGHAMPWYDRNGKLIGAIESLRDISEKYREKEQLRTAEKELQDEVHFLQNLLSKLGGLICSIDMDGFMGFSNDSFQQFLGYTADELKGKHISDVTTADSFKLIEKRLTAQELEESQDLFELEFYHKDGRQLYTKSRLQSLEKEQEAIGFLIQAEEIK